MNLVTGWLSQIERVELEKLDCNATLKHKALIPIGRTLSFGVPAHMSFDQLARRYHPSLEGITHPEWRCIGYLARQSIPSWVG